MTLATVALARTSHATPRISRRPLAASIVAVMMSLLLAMSGPVRASSVLQISFDELCAESDLIFEGRVVSVEASEDPASPLIWTHVTIDIAEVIQGRLDAGRVELKFLGGSAGGRRLQVTNMKIPQVGEHGIYFVEAKDRRQVHPLLGWQQGHFRIETGPDGSEHVTTAARRVVSGVDPSMAPKRGDLSAGTAAGVQVLGDERGAARAMGVSDFKSAVREVLTRRGAVVQ
jgi:hypothetical protein